MSVGKNPHRPEGKADTDNPHMQAAWMEEGPPHSHPSQKEVHQQNMDAMDRLGAERMGEDREQQIGGSRPGVESRVKDAIRERRERESEEEE